MSGGIPKRWHIYESLYDVYTIKNIRTSDVHWHSHFLLSLVLEGEGVQMINGVKHEFFPGSIFVLSPLDFHRNIIEDCRNVTVGGIKFSDKLFYDSLCNVCELSGFPIAARLSPREFDTARELFSLLLYEAEDRTRAGSDIFALGLISQLVIYALRAAGGGEPPRESTSVRRALIYTNYNFRKNIRVTDVARHVGYSPNYFSAEFKKSTGLEFQKYLQELRLGFAMNLLRFSNLSVTEICFESGFNTLSHFSGTFKKKYGASPEKFREVDI